MVVGLIGLASGVDGGDADGRQCLVVCLLMPAVVVPSRTSP
jgi:hypothetical protein